MSGVVLGHHQEARSALVEAVDDAGPKDPADPRQVSHVVQQRVHQRAPRGPRSRMNDQASGLVDHQEVLVLVEDAQRDALGAGLGGRRSEEP